MSSRSLTYAPGEWTGVVTPQVWGLVLIPLDDARVADVWDAAGLGIDDILDVLARHGLRSLPGFVLVEADGNQRRYLVRAPAVLTVDEQPVSPNASGPWTEGVLPDATARLRLSASGSTAGMALPTSSGVSPVDALMVDLSADSPSATSSTAPDPESESIAELEPEEPEPEEPESGDPEPAATEESGESGDHAAEYYQLLVSSTSDLETLRAKLNDADAAEAENPKDPEPATPGHQDGATGIWTDELADLDAVPEVTEGAGSSPEPTSPEPAEPPADDAAGTPARASGLIDGLPWASGSSAVGAVTPPTPAPPASTPAAPYPSLPQPPSMPRPPVEATPPTAPAATSPPDGGHEADADAVTTSRAALLRQLAEERPLGPSVLAVQCPRGHLSPSYAVACRICGAQLPEQTPVEVARPPLGRLVLSTGTSVLLDRGVIFGRAPHSDIADAAMRPNLVRLVESGEISRMHASVTLDGWQVLVRDLGSQNGTIVTLPGAEPEQIRPNQDHTLEPGSVVSLADVVTFTYEIGE